MTQGVYRRESPEETSRRLKLLAALLNLSLMEKLKLTERIIAEGLEKGNPALLYSGGRDSTVLLVLVQKVCKDIAIIHNDTGLGDPVNLQFVRIFTQGMNFLETTADPITMWSEKGYYPIFSKRGFSALRRKHPKALFNPVLCCYNLKERFSKAIFRKNNAEVVFWGNRAAEGNRRKLTFVDNGFLFKPKIHPWWYCYPLQHWRDEDINDFLAAEVPQYPAQKTYENGCLCCGIDWGYYPNNLCKLYDANPRLWKKYMLSEFGRQLALINGLKPDMLDEILESKPGLLLWYRHARKGKSL